MVEGDIDRGLGHDEWRGGEEWEEDDMEIDV